jgi:hypothetical protein
MITEGNNNFAPEKLETTIVSMDNLDGGGSFQETTQSTDVAETTDNVAITDTTTTETAETTDIVEIQYEDEKVLEYLKSKGIDASDFESLKTPKEVNSYDDLLDDEDKAYLNFKKETGKKISRKEYNDIVSKDYNNVSSIDLAKERVLSESGLSLTDDEVLEYLEEELGFDPNAEDLTPRERIKLASYVKDIREAKIQEQKTIIDKLPASKGGNEYDNDNYVKLDNGTIVSKEAYEQSVAKRNDFIRLNKEAVSRAADFDFNMTVNDNGVERQLSYTHKLDQKDLQRLESITSDVFSHLDKTYRKGEGYDAVSLNKNMAWADESLRGKMLDSFAHQIRANAIEELMKESGNINLSPSKFLDQQKERGVKIIPIDEL